MIRKSYTAPREQHTLRHFCGFCGTPLTYWSEEPRAEADYIQLTLGSLCSEDLGDLEDLGLLPDPESPQTPTDTAMAADDERVAVYEGNDTVGGLPWFDSLVEGSRLGTMKTTKGSHRSQDGTVRVEWEIVEYTEDDGDGNDTPQSGKRKLGEREDGDGPSSMEGVQR